MLAMARETGGMYACWAVRSQLVGMHAKVYADHPSVYEEIRHTRLYLRVAHGRFITLG